MRPSPEYEIVMRLLRSASAGQPIPAEGHIVEDEELMACWESGLLLSNQREGLLAHLAICPQCRRELAELIRRGDFQVAQPEPVAAPVPAPAAVSRWGRRWLSLAVSACLLVAVGIVGWTLWRPDGSLGIPSHSALAMRGRVTDYGYLLDGQLLAAKGPMFDASLDRRKQELELSLKAKPDDRSLCLDYGETLLRQQQPAEAAEIFRKMLESNSNDAAARLGLGLAQFQQGHFDDALRQFDAVLRTDPDNLAARLDAAACLARLGRTADAIQYWRDALARTQDGPLRTHIEQTIQNNR